MNVKLLGFEIDEELSFSEYITTVCKNVSRRIGLLKKKLWIICPLNKDYFIIMLWSGQWLIMQVSRSGLIVIRKAFGGSWGSKNEQQSNPECPPLALSVPLFNRLKWLPFYKDALISKCIIAYKQLQGDVPAYLNDLLKLNSNIHSRQTRYCNLT